MYKDRVKLYQELEKTYNGKVITYFTSDRPYAGAQIADDAIDYFIEHLEKMGYQDRLILYIYTRGGHVSSSWTIINLLRMYCKELYVVVPYKCHSGGTLICLGSDKIIMTRYAQLGPIDPSITRGESDNKGQTREVRVGVEEVEGYVKFGKEELSIRDRKGRLETFSMLSEAIGPTFLGDVYRTRQQIQMLADKLLVHQITDKKKKKEVISFLCSESGSHDYTINYEEAKQLGLNVTLAEGEENKLIKEIYDDIKDETELLTPFRPQDTPGFNRSIDALIESVDGGSDCCLIEMQTIGEGSKKPNVVVTYQGWRHNEKTNTKKKSKMNLEEELPQYEIHNDESM